MAHEVVDALMQPGGPDATYLDCTFGRGGHSQEVLRELSPAGRLIAFDIDPLTAQSARNLQRDDARFRFHNRPMGDLLKVVRPEVSNLMGVLLDLGNQTTTAEERSRWSAFGEDGPLDLRLNPSYGLSASQWLQTVTEPELAWVIHEHGEDTDVILAHRLAEAILERQRRMGPYRSCAELVDVCREAKQGVDDRGQHPAKLTFQALRTFLNHGVSQMQLAMAGALERLASRGRLVVISHGRKEVTQVKRFLREHEMVDQRFNGFVTAQRLAELYPLRSTALPYGCRQVCAAIRASPAEGERNTRARNALVHVLQKELRTPADPAARESARPRPLEEQFKRPVSLPFVGAAEEGPVIGLWQRPQGSRDSQHDTDGSAQTTGRLPAYFNVGARAASADGAEDDSSVSVEI